MKSAKPAFLLRHSFGLLTLLLWLGALITVTAQPPGGALLGRAGRGFGPPIPREQMETINRLNQDLAAEAAAVNVASSNLVAASFSTPKDEAKIIAANHALNEARLAWATKAAALFAKVQDSPNKLDEAAIAQLISTAPGGRGGSGPAKPGRAGNQTPATEFVRPAASPGLGQPMVLPGPDAEGFISMFNGRDLSGWDALPNFWSVKDGVIDCVETTEPGGNVQSDLTWIDSRENPAKYANFELRLKFRWNSTTGNSGVQFRGKMDNAATKHVGGYQADMDPANAYTGAIYDESGLAGRRQNSVGGPHLGPRGFRVAYPAGGGAAKVEPLPDNSQALAALIKPVAGDFNEMVILADGSHLTVKINGHVFCEVIDEYDNALKSGLIAFQQHAGAKMEVQFKDPKIKFLPAK